MAIVGIDLGTTNSLVAAYVDGEPVLIPNAYGEYLTPSVVSMGDDGRMLVGKLARERLVTDPKHTAARFKRLMGTDETIALGLKKYKPEELSAFVLRQLIADAEAYLGEPVTEAVISVPAYFDVRQRAATKRAGALAGIRVERLVNEPSAAALAHRREGEDASFVVFDFGGGTLDVSVVDCFDNVVSISAVSGDNQLGGSDFDAAIADAACLARGISPEKLRPAARESLLREAESAKRELSEGSSPAIIVGGAAGFPEPFPLTNEKLFSLSSEMFARIEKPLRQALYDSDLDSSDIDRVILVGGSCHMPVVRKYLQRLLAVRVSSSDDCDYAVARGLGTYVGIKARAEEVRDLVLTDICPFSLSTEVRNENPPYYPLASFLIRRNSILPTSRTKTYQTGSTGQRTLSFSVFQGEGVYAKDNLKLADFSMKIPVKRNEYTPFEVTFTYDINAILGVEVRLLDDSLVKRFVYTGDGWAESKEALERLDEVQMALRLDGTRLDAEYVRERAIRVAAESHEDVQEYLLMLLGQFGAILESNNLRNIHRRTREFNEILDAIEGAKGADGIFRQDGGDVDWLDPEAWTVDDDDEGGWEDSDYEG